MKCWKISNAQGSRLIIVVALQLGAVKIYAATVEEALMKKERQGETQFNIKNWGPPTPSQKLRSLNANVFFGNRPFSWLNFKKIMK
jgi:hypothetical protein